MATVHERLQQAAEYLGTDHGITLVLSAGTSTRGDAWTDAHEKHGDRVSLIHIEDGQWGGQRPRQRDLFRDRTWHDVNVLMVDYPWNDAAIGGAIRDVLTASGFNVEWNGDGTQALEIKLGG